MPVISPYIARWSGERISARGLQAARSRGGQDARLFYRDEQPADRDGKGVLWLRCPDVPQSGRLNFGKIHPRRQRDAMWRMLCQVCGGEPDENADGLLWLLPGGPEVFTAMDPLLTPYPPICASCLRNAVKMCPDLRGRYSVLRVREVHLHGVLALPHIMTRDGRLGRVGSRSRRPPAIAYDDQRMPMSLAIQQVIALDQFVIIGGPDGPQGITPGAAAPAAGAAILAGLTR